MVNSGFRLGQLFGININIDFSWIFIFLLITGSLVFGLFPSIHPEWSPLLSGAVGLSASFLFFSSVLAHELAHSLVARSKGLPIRNITLFLFGGVSDIEREPPSAGAEFIIAIVGPLTSIVLGMTFLLLGGATIGSPVGIVTDPRITLSQLGPITTLLLWIGSVNVLLGFFNLIPGFPLDGGRLLRSLIWAINNNLRSATRIASSVGQGVSWLFILTGVLMIFGVRIPILGAGLINGLWLIFIGWFLNNAAAVSYRQVVVDDILKNVPVARLMKTDIVAVGPDVLVSDLVDNFILKTDRRAFPVLKNDKLTGLVTLEDVRKVDRQMWDRKKVNEIMTPVNGLEVVTAREGSAEALRKIAARDVGQLPVMENGRLVGIIDRGGILTWLKLNMDNQNGD